MSFKPYSLWLLSYSSLNWWREMCSVSFLAQCFSLASETSLQQHNFCIFCNKVCNNVYCFYIFVSSPSLVLAFTKYFPQEHYFVIFLKKTKQNNNPQSVYKRGCCALFGDEAEALTMFYNSNCHGDRKELKHRSNKIQYQDVCKITITKAYFVFALQSYSLCMFMIFSTICRLIFSLVLLCFNKLTLNNIICSWGLATSH